MQTKKKDNCYECILLYCCGSEWAFWISTTNYFTLNTPLYCTNTSMYIHLYTHMHNVTHTYNSVREREYHDTHTHTHTRTHRVEQQYVEWQKEQNNRHAKLIQQAHKLRRDWLTDFREVHLFCFCFLSFRLSANSKVPSWGRWMSSE